MKLTKTARMAKARPFHINRKVAGGATGVVVGAVMGGPVGALIGGVAGTALGSIGRSSKRNNFTPTKRRAVKLASRSKRSSIKAQSKNGSARKSSARNSATRKAGR